MLNSYISEIILQNLKHKPTEQQSEAVNLLAEFIKPDGISDKIFLLKGYAGTGKTTLISALVSALDKLKIKSVLLAPTGRAAKVLGNYSQKDASTIHKKIFRQKSGSNFDKYVLDINTASNTIFIVDEASMISNSSADNTIFGSGRLLEDLIEYIYNGKGCKLILSGDTAQLPPVKLDISPALEKKTLESYGYSVFEFEMKQVVRQSFESGILFNATNIRNIISENKTEFNNNGKFPKISLKNYTDIEKVEGNELIEKISDAYSTYTLKEVAIICRTNKRANKFNQGIRNTVLFREEELSPGDMVMIVKNNHFWVNDTDDIDFIANGDIAEIKRIKNYTERYGYRFADAVLIFPDYNEIEIEAKIILDTLHTETASMSHEQYKEFYAAIEQDYSEIKNKRQRYKIIREHPFFNAMQIKYAYAVTCHKAQGGQWKKVFIDQGFVQEDMINTEYLRWLYTAFTRASKELSLVNFRKEFFYENEIS